MFQKGELPFNRKTADKIIAIANNDNPHGSHLPVQWTTLYALTKLTDEQFDNGIRSGAINLQIRHGQWAAATE